MDAPVCIVDEPRARSRAIYNSDVIIIIIIIIMAWDVTVPVTYAESRIGNKYLNTKVLKYVLKYYLGTYLLVLKYFRKLVLSTYT